MDEMEAPSIANAYYKEYYQANKEKCNHQRLANYHKVTNNIPTDQLDTYLKCSSVYKLIRKNKDKLDLDFIKFLLAEVS